MGLEQLAAAPAWAIQALTEAVSATAARSSEIPSDLKSGPPVRLDDAALELWTGQRLLRKDDGEIDRSRTLYVLGCELARAGASEGTITEALAERDHALGLEKYHGRKDRDLWYYEIAQKAVAAQSDPAAPKSDKPPSSTPSSPVKKGERPWPEPPGDAAFYGLAGRMVEAACPHTEADRVALLTTFLAAFGCAVGASPHAKVGATRHTPRIFATLVGRTAKARKGDSIQAVRVIFEQAFLDWPARSQSGLSSGEGLIFAVRDPIEKLMPVKEKGEPTRYEMTLVDPGVEDKRLFVGESEFARVLKVISRQGNTLSPVLREAWDTGNLRVMTRKDPLCATNAHIVLLGHITVEELRKELLEVEVANGFGNRILWVAVQRSQFLPEPEPFEGEHVQALVNELSETVDDASAIGLMWARRGSPRALALDLWGSRLRPRWAGGGAARESGGERLASQPPLRAA
ncbi:MAG: hypothetical protein HY329_17200 [Chloroflexi bacterium]|nr:hypothetical protein [Chloroflexota bacterium]